MPVQKYKFFTPADAARVSHLQLTARQVVEGMITGLHKSPHRGFSVEFSEHRNYVSGDELRHLDWRAYARSDRYYIKLFEQETNLRATIVLDTSASMSFGMDSSGAPGSATPATAKIDYARHLAGCIAYLLAMQQDLAGLVAIDESVQVQIPAGSSPAHLDRLFKALEEIQPGKTTHLAEHLHALAERLPRRSLVILISDLWLEPDALLKALQHLRYRKHQCLMIHLLNQAEIDLPYQQQITLQDLETGEKLQIDPADLRNTYHQQVQDYLTLIRRACNDADVEYHIMDTATPYDKALINLLARRR
ncbi:MAG: DUF58 domain-containing protein [Phycisphaerales bacterium]|nr:DUF58 domain-containing protein [Phycisphaerales bacterium]